jgi:LCP family protein required for cell wall assembly
MQANLTGVHGRPAAKTVEPTAHNAAVPRPSATRQTMPNRQIVRRPKIDSFIAPTRLKDDTPKLQPAGPSRSLPKLTNRPITPSPSVAHADKQPVAAAQTAEVESSARKNSKFRQASKAKKTKPKLTKRWSFRVAASAAIVLLLTGGILTVTGFFNMNKVFKGGASAVALQKDVNPNLLKGEGDGRVNVLLLGRGGLGHEAPDLTDTIILASIDPVNKTATLLSLPRDLWVNVPGYGKMKINAAYSAAKYRYLGKIDNKSNDKKAIQAGFSLVDQTVEDVLGVPIHYHVLVDFHAFKQSVDTVGGVKVNVPEDLYDATMAWENNRNPLLAKAGMQEFDGTRALMYVRSRKSSSDFARSERQRAVLVALKDKVLTAGTLSNPVKITKLMNALGDNVQTDLNLNDMPRLYEIVKNISSDKIQSVGLTDADNNFLTTGNIGGSSIVKPIAGLFKYDEIREFVRSKLPDGYILKEKANVMVLNGTSQSALANTVADNLKSYGYNISSIDNAPTDSYGQTVLVDLTHGKKKYTKNYLENRFRVDAKTSLPDQSIQPNGADFVIIVGRNEASRSQN